MLLARAHNSQLIVFQLITILQPYLALQRQNSAPNCCIEKFKIFRKKSLIILQRFAVMFSVNNSIQ